MSNNIHQIFKELNWLAELFNYRWEFLYCNESYKDRVSEYIGTHQSGRNGANYKPLKFNLVRHDFEHTIDRKESYTHKAEIIHIQGAYVYSEPGTLYHPDDDPHPLFITIGDHPWDKIEIKEAKDGWFRFVKHYCTFTDTVKSDYKPVSSLSDKIKDAWLPIDYIDAPANYHPDFSWKEYKTGTEHWTEEQKKKVRENLQLKDKAAFWLKFYTEQDLRQVAPPPLDTQASPYAQFIEQHQLGVEDRALLALTIANQIRPDYLLPLIERARLHPDLGGASGRGFKGFIPTGETYLFLMAGRNTFLRGHLMEHLLERSTLVKEGLIGVVNALPGEPFFSGILAFHPEQIPALLSPNPSLPDNAQLTY
ncbi:hypothetical protein [Microscilla marina]|uniref:Uncharacterized protein n=1 Tax=Microscilla marina ATCC 23134 TaxID=313606 RepID=A1ZWH4_MICM2|nr:hypothetical protein [Microscilla marina]EAY25214.1 hypothetical protein M23134_07950 [Microscilla marina ATCC 23134]